MLFSVKNQLHQPPENGFEPPQQLENLTPEILQETLQKHVKNCARKTGIEKSLAVRQGIAKVIYGKDNITVRFRWGLSTDGKEATGSSPSVSAPGLSAPPAVCPPENERRPGPLLGTDPHFQFATEKMWSGSSRPPTIDITIPNIAHDYWQNYRLTGDYNVRPSLLGIDRPVANGGGRP
jgi:hypothetical protein